MDKTPLVEREIEAGRRLVQALDQEGFQVIAALWSYFSEEGEWRLLIASPQVNKVGPRPVYSTIQEVLLKTQIDLPLYRVSAVTPEDPIVGELRIFAGTDPAPFIGSTYIHGTVVGDKFIEGAYIYRAQRIIGTNGIIDLPLATFDKARRVWISRPGKVTVENGFFKQIEVNGFDLPQTRTKHGINAYLWVPSYTEVRDGQTFGDVTRQTIIGGRLRRIETVAHSVPIEFVVSTPPPATASEAT